MKKRAEYKGGPVILVDTILRYPTYRGEYPENEIVGSFEMQRATQSEPMASLIGTCMSHWAQNRVRQQDYRIDAPDEGDVIRFECLIEGGPVTIYLPGSFEETK